MKIFKKAMLPQGFIANGVFCGLKKSGKPDLSLIYSEVSALGAIKFTSNTLPAAPIRVNNLHFKKSKLFRAIIANSGNANAFTGESGLQKAFLMAESAALGLGITKESVLVASTGIISKPLDLEKIESAMPELIRGLSRKGIAKAEQAIMTTDKFPKEITVKFRISGKPVTLCAIAKGAGMISPKMATMLVFVLTDACVGQEVLRRCLDQAVERSFNCITVDGCMSTNDTVILLANQQAGNRKIISGKDLGSFQESLNFACLELAKMMVRDGEGSTKLIQLKVLGAANYTEANKIALSIANSNLFKTAMFASSPNVLGRIVAAVGATGIAVKENALKIKYTSLKKRDVRIEVSLGRGKSDCQIYTSDLSHEYVKINAEYN